MNKEIKTKLDNVLKSKGDYILKNENDKNKKIDKMNTIFNMKKIIDNYDELEPVLIEFFSEKAEKSRFDR